jgi:hypothetical protein
MIMIYILPVSLCLGVILLVLAVNFRALAISGDCLPLRLDTLADIDRAYAEYDNLLRNSDQIGKVLVDASDKLRSITQGNENFIERHKKAYEEFTELASKYGLW